MSLWLASNIYSMEEKQQLRYSNVTELFRDFGLWSKIYEFLLRDFKSTVQRKVRPIILILQMGKLRHKSQHLEIWVSEVRQLNP